MRKIILMILFFTMSVATGGFSQDNMYGDYLLFSLEKRISLDLEDAQLIDVLKMLSKQTKLNFISTEAIRQRSLTLYIEDMPIKEALDIIFMANNLAYDYYPEANIYVLKEMGRPTIELKTKVYTLAYASVESSRLKQEMAAMMVRTTLGEEEEAGESTAGGGGGSKLSKDPVTIRAAVEAVLSEFGRVTQDPATNSLIVVDVPAQFPMIDEVISKLDVPVPKVMIEVEMLDVSRTILDKFGFDYTGTDSTGFTGTFTPFAAPWNVLAEHLSIKSATLDHTSTFAIMKFLKEDTTTKFLGRPKILTLANQTAEVSLTSWEVIGIKITTDSNGNQESEAERAFTGTKLRVTPQISPDRKEITLAVDIFNKEAVDSGLSSPDLTGNYQNVDERSARSVVRINNGDTLFIGGLLSKNQSTTLRKIPFLGDIPFVGSFFRYKEKLPGGNVDRELLVFLTPRVIEDMPFSDKKIAMLKREQIDFSKKDAMKVALDSFIR